MCFQLTCFIINSKLLTSTFKLWYVCTYIISCRQRSQLLASKANRLLDELLNKAKDYLVVHNSRTIEIPPLNIIFKTKSPEARLGKLRTDNGTLENLSTLTRLKDLSLFEDDSVFYIYGNINMKTFKVSEWTFLLCYLLMYGTFSKWA